MDSPWQQTSAAPFRVLEGLLAQREERWVLQPRAERTGWSCRSHGTQRRAAGHLAQPWTHSPARQEDGESVRRCSREKSHLDRKGGRFGGLRPSTFKGLGQGGGSTQLWSTDWPVSGLFPDSTLLHATVFISPCPAPKVHQPICSPAQGFPCRWPHRSSLSPSWVAR